MSEQKKYKKLFRADSEIYLCVDCDCVPSSSSEKKISCYKKGYVSEYIEINALKDLEAKLAKCKEALEKAQNTLFGINSHQKNEDNCDHATEALNYIYKGLSSIKQIGE